MSRVVVERVVSDLSGQEIPEGKAWTMTLTPPDRRRNPIRLDISEEEARQWLSRGTEVKRRGRRPGSTSAAGRESVPANGRRRSAAKTAASRARSGKGKSANGRRRRT
jgi:hypothetical protein